MDRFKMNFNNGNYIPTYVVNNTAKINAPMASKPASLNSPMIERVHKAKPGCSACGKKVA